MTLEWNGTKTVQFKKKQTKNFPNFGGSSSALGSLPVAQSKAPASRLKRFASSAIAEAVADGTYQVSAAIKKAGTMTEDNLKNAERDLHALFRKYGLALPLEISTLKCGLFHLHYICLTSWFRYLLNDFSHLLLGGFNIDDPKATLLLKSFWESFRVANGDHWVFSQHGANLQKCVPYYLHLDEGTSLRKSAILVFNLQAAWGSETKSEFENRFASESGRTDSDMARFMLESQCHNQRGSSLLTRFLITAIPKRWYTKKNDFVYDKFLTTIAGECLKLALESTNGMFMVCLGVKGDAPALAKAGHYTRSFLRLGMVYSYI